VYINKGNQYTRQLLNQSSIWTSLPIEAVGHGKEVEKGPERIFIKKLELNTSL
jgi:hypothetical protein